MNTNKNLVGVTGEYFVCAELGKRGITAIPAQKNNPLFDIIAIDNKAEQKVTIQVKTMSLKNKQGWNLGKKITEPTHNPDMFVVLVNLKEKENDYYIFKYDNLGEIVDNIYKKYLSVPKKDGNKKKETAIRWINIPDLPDHGCNNNWDLLGFASK